MLLDCAKCQLTPEELNNKLFLDKDITRKTVRHGAAEKGQLELLDKLWDRARELLSPEDISNKFLLTEDERLNGLVRGNKDGQPRIMT